MVFLVAAVAQVPTLIGVFCAVGAGEVSFFLLTAVYFGESVVCVFADGVEEGLQCGWSVVFVDDYEFAVFIVHVSMYIIKLIVI